MSDEIAASEFQARMKSVAMEFLNSRKVSGDLTMQMMFSVLSLLKSKNKITDKDLDVIFEVEKETVGAMLEEYFNYTHGDRNARMQNEEELKVVSKYAFAEIDNYRKQVAGAATDLKPVRKPRKPPIEYVTEGEDPRPKAVAKRKKKSETARKNSTSSKQPKSDD